MTSLRQHIRETLYEYYTSNVAGIDELSNDFVFERSFMQPIIMFRHSLLMVHQLVHVSGEIYIFVATIKIIPACLAFALANAVQSTE